MTIRIAQLHSLLKYIASLACIMKSDSPTPALSQPSDSMTWLGEEWLLLLNRIVEKGYYSVEEIQEMLNTEKYDEYVTAVVNEVANVDDEIANACVQIMGNMADGTQTSDVGQAANNVHMPEKFSHDPENKQKIQEQDDQIQEMPRGNNCPLPSSPVIAKRKHSPIMQKAESVKVGRVERKESVGLGISHAESLSDRGLSINKMDEAKEAPTEQNHTGNMKKNTGLSSDKSFTSGMDTTSINASDQQISSKPKKSAIYSDETILVANPTSQQLSDIEFANSKSNSMMEIKKSAAASPVFMKKKPPGHKTVRKTITAAELVSMVEELDTFGKNDVNCKLAIAKSVHDKHVQIARSMVELVREQKELLKKAQQLLAERKQEKQRIKEQLHSALESFSDKKK